MRTKYSSVRLESLTLISSKCYKWRSWGGKEGLIPKSVVYGPDLEVRKSEAWWIASWWLKKQKLPYSIKKVKWFNNY
jgi:hypothetical protein